MLNIIKLNVWKMEDFLLRLDERLFRYKNWSNIIRVKYLLRAVFLFVFSDKRVKKKCFFHRESENFFVVIDSSLFFKSFSRRSLNFVE